VYGGDENLLAWIRSAWSTSLLVNRPERPRAEIAVDVDAEVADVASIGRFALANPDLVERLQRNQPLNEADPTTFFGGDAHGYTDYPTYAG
jgi:2,4-dienoyl-CoA reductase-like NADH-dependent reductase (Old Yellow Enzyme family)